MRTWEYIDHVQYEELMDALAKRYSLRKGFDGITYLGFYPMLLSDGNSRHAMHVDFSTHVDAYKRSQTQTEEARAHAAEPRSPCHDVRVKRAEQSVGSHPIRFWRWMKLSHGSAGTMKASPSHLQLGVDRVNIVAGSTTPVSSLRLQAVTAETVRGLFVYPPLIRHAP
jgi:hypothetical protein